MFVEIMVKKKLNLSDPYYAFVIIGELGFYSTMLAWNISGCYDTNSLTLPREERCHCLIMGAKSIHSSIVKSGITYSCEWRR